MKIEFATVKEESRYYDKYSYGGVDLYPDTADEESFLSGLPKALDEERLSIWISSPNKDNVKLAIEYGGEMRTFKIMKKEHQSMLSNCLRGNGDYRRIACFSTFQVPDDPAVPFEEMVGLFERKFCMIRFEKKKSTRQRELKEYLKKEDTMSSSSIL